MDKVERKNTWETQYASVTTPYIFVATDFATFADSTKNNLNNW